MWEGSSATPEGTMAYRQRHLGKVGEGHFHQLERLWLSSIGLGTYLGEHDEATDRLYQEAITRAVTLGCNVIDTAINYRFQRSERAIGQTLATLFQFEKVARPEIVIATKGGFIPFDGGPPRDPLVYFEETFVKTGVARPQDLVAGCHCMAPDYVRHQLAVSLHNLGLACVDIYYLHNPETQLQEVSRPEFLRRLRAAFGVLEEGVAAGKLLMYGTATWNAYRSPPQGGDYLSLQEVVGVAKEVGGVGHHFKVIQLPLNLAMPEAFTQRNQQVDGEWLSPLQAADRLGIYVMASASLSQSRLARGLPPFIGSCLTGLATDAQRAIQFVRSSPGLGTALIGMKQIGHVEENLSVAQSPPVSSEQYLRLFRREE